MADVKAFVTFSVGGNVGEQFNAFLSIALVDSDSDVVRTNTVATPVDYSDKRDDLDGKIVDQVSTLISELNTAESLGLVLKQTVLLPEFRKL